MSSVFLDTDVILDLFIEREPDHSVASRFFSYLQVHADSIQAFWERRDRSPMLSRRSKVCVTLCASCHWQRLK